MKFIFKILKYVIILILLIFIYLVYNGYTTYSKAIEETPILETIEEIRNGENYITIDKMTKDYTNAVVAVEDHRFENHNGIDVFSIGRAFLNNIMSMSMLEGGSTITQQVAKNVFFTQEQTLNRKIAEIFLALDLEELYSKNDILEIYVNTNYFGSGYYGIGKAAQGYYDKLPIDLSFEEAVILAGIPNAPSIYSLDVNPDLAYERANQVIYAMYEHGYIEEAVYL